MRNVDQRTAARPNIGNISRKCLFERIESLQWCEFIRRCSYSLCLFAVTSSLTNGVITLAVSSTRAGTVTRIGTRTIGDNKFMPLSQVQVQCERFYINHTTHLSMSRSRSLSQSRRQKV